MLCKTLHTMILVHLFMLETVCIRKVVKIRGGFVVIFHRSSILSLRKLPANVENEACVCFNNLRAICCRDLLKAHPPTGTGSRTHAVILERRPRSMQVCARWLKCRTERFTPSWSHIVRERSRGQLKALRWCWGSSSQQTAGGSLMHPRYLFSAIFWWALDEQTIQLFLFRYF